MLRSAGSVIVAAFSLLALVPSSAAAQAYPARPIRGIVGFVPGGATDILARQLAQKLSESLGHSKEIEGRLLAEGSVIGGMPPAQFSDYIRAEIAKWTRVVKEAGIKVE